MSELKWTNPPDFRPFSSRMSAIAFEKITFARHRQHGNTDKKLPPCRSVTRCGRGAFHLHHTCAGIFAAVLFKTAKGVVFKSVKLHIVITGVDAARLEKLLVVSALDDALVGYHYNLVGAPNCT
jgi:hypothetical protein